MYYVYVFVRQDIPLADQIVQVGHACLEAGCRYKNPEETPNLVLLGLKNIYDLDKARIYLLEKKIEFVVFDEPDDEMGETAICTQIVNDQLSFKRWELWKS